MRTSSAARARCTVLGFSMLLGFAFVLANSALGAREHLPEVPSCDVPPRTFEEITRLIQLGGSIGSATGSTAIDESVSPATFSQVQAVLAQFVACSGAGEPLRVWSLYTDAYLSRLLSRERGYDRVRFGLDSEPRPIAASDWPRLSVLADVREDGSGRTVTDVTVLYPNLDRSKQLRFWFAWQDGLLRIDEVDGEITFGVP